MNGFISATEILLDVMTKNHIQRLVYVGDAFAVLPPGDNYGLSEYMHQTLPARFMLGCYGESKARAEFVVRRAAEKGEVSAIILRPTFIFGEGEPHLVSMAKKVCMAQGGIPNINGDDRGNHQFVIHIKIYAGNMAAIMERCLRCLIDEPEKYNNEVIFCVDRTTCTPFKDFILPYMKAAGFKHCEAQSYLRSFISAAYTSLLSKFDPGTCRDHLTLNAHRFLNGWTVGFSNRKLRLLLDFVPPFDQQEAMKQSLAWYERNDCIPEQRQSITIANERPRMG
ncbi:unnamed protein product [Anisakis simplex]|uniref:3-beta hydroxysteroid dehydrogenase/isomerase domain-containing protein n=1 Tax=Anisakis simplex TaxID=6269 RepID=A0A3P6SBN3_ANISI|nr:unnamed protein product [Anisakis simplex]